MDEITCKQAFDKHYEIFHEDVCFLKIPVNDHEDLASACGSLFCAMCSETEGLIPPAKAMSDDKTSLEPTGYFVPEILEENVKIGIPALIADDNTASLNAPEHSSLSGLEAPVTGRVRRSRFH